jgi:hypothetical protein
VPCYQYYLDLNKQINVDESLLFQPMHGIPSLCMRYIYIICPCYSRSFSRFWHFLNFHNLRKVEISENIPNLMQIPDPTLHQKFGLCRTTFEQKVWVTCEFLYENLHEVKTSNWIKQNTPSVYTTTWLCVDTTPFPSHSAER